MTISYLYIDLDLWVVIIKYVLETRNLSDSMDARHRSEAGAKSSAGHMLLLT